MRKELWFIKKKSLINQETISINQENNVEETKNTSWGNEKIFAMILIHIHRYSIYFQCMYDIVHRDIFLAKQEGFCVGLKVVRGAYIVEVSANRSLLFVFVFSSNFAYIVQCSVSDRRLPFVSKCHEKSFAGLLWPNLATFTYF